MTDISSAVMTLLSHPGAASLCAAVLVAGLVAHRNKETEGPVEDNSALFSELRAEVKAASSREPSIKEVLRVSGVSRASSLEMAVASSAAWRLQGDGIGSEAIRLELMAALTDQAPLPHIASGMTLAGAVRADIEAVLTRDPASEGPLAVLLFFKGFASLVAQRAAHRCWLRGDKIFALYLQSRVSVVCGVDMHPGARIGAGIMLDHATGVVVGETAVIGDGCTLLHGVTLGGTGKDRGDRHPKIGKDVLLGAGSTVLGNISIGDGAKIGCASVVLRPVPSGATAVGSPAKIIGRAKEAKPASELDQGLTNVAAPTDLAGGGSSPCSSGGSGGGSAEGFLCVWRSLQHSDPKAKGVDISMLRNCMRSKGISDAEIGEIFFALDEDQDGLVSAQDFARNFKQVARKFSSVCECPQATAALEKAISEAASRRGGSSGNLSALP